MHTEVRHKTASQIGCLIALVCFSALLAINAYPYLSWKFGAAFGLLTFASLFLSVGWFVPFTIAGSYFGMFVLDPSIKGGTIESQMNETAGSIVMGTIVGFAIGAMIDLSRRVDQEHDSIQWRFSLRTLLIATTLIAVVLGIVVISLLRVVNDENGIAISPIPEPAG
jgi:hypothetical protein